MKQLLFRFLGIVLISALASSCGTTTKILADDTSQLDPNFAGYKGVVLIVRNYDNKSGYNNVDRSVLKGFKKYYKGEFLMISNKDVPKYTDTDKYRFVVHSNLMAQRVYGSPPSSIQHSWYVMVDQKTKKETKTKVYEGYTGLEELPKVFETLRASK
jgi:hypothetical protein